MKKYIIFFVLTIFLIKPFCLYAQNLKVVYDVDITTSKNKITEEMLLLINEDNSVYISPVKKVADSLKQFYIKKNDILGYQAEKYNLKTYLLKYAIYKTNKHYTYQVHAGFNELTYKESLPMLKWKVEKQNKNISGFNAQKATAIYNNQVITAWFTKDIPINNGPYIFQGLPGLILSVNNQNNTYVINFKGIQKNSEKLPTPLIGTKVVSTTKSNFESAFLGCIKEITSKVSNQNERKKMDSKANKLMSAKYLFHFL